MGADPRGFLEFDRQPLPERDPALRTEDHEEFIGHLPEADLKHQAARCMDCGVPFCQSESGCPIDNLIPEWNELVAHGRWQEALARLHSTNNFPEFTGRVCPAPCESACVLGINQPPVTIKNVERSLIDHGFAQGWVKPEPPARRSDKRVAVVGSGPAGLAAAQQLNRAGHTVTVYERDDCIGGLLTYGIPNMKLDKQTVERRVDLMRQEGIQFVTGQHIGVNKAADALLQDNDALLLAVGATVPRDLSIPGRDLKGVHFAMDYLHQSTERLLHPDVVHAHPISAKDKRVVVIGGGDTGTDCIGTALREGCSALTNLELMPRPPTERTHENPWPEWPRIFRVDYGHLEANRRFGRDPRDFAVTSKRFIDDGRGAVAGVEVASVDWSSGAERRPRSSERPFSARIIEADLVFLAMGFTGPEPRLAEQLGLERDERSNLRADLERFATTVEGVFAAGDCRRGQSLIVWAIAEGRAAARAIDAYLVGESQLPAPAL